MLTLYSVCTLCSVQWLYYKVYSVQWLYNRVYSGYTIECTVYNGYTIECTVYNGCTIECTVYSSQYSCGLAPALPSALRTHPTIQKLNTLQETMQFRALQQCCAMKLSEVP